MPIIVINKDNIYYLKYTKKVISKCFIYTKKTLEKYTYYVRLGKFCLEVSDSFS